MNVRTEINVEHLLLGFIHEDAGARGREVAVQGHRTEHSVGTWGWGTFVSYQFELRVPFDPAVPFLGVPSQGKIYTRAQRGRYKAWGII